MNYRKKTSEEVPEELTPIWSCTSESCNGWMRDNFAFDYSPVCPLCSSAMEKGSKMLPLLVNNNTDMKSLKKGVSIQP
ncbi:cold-shock protein [Paenibacillus sp. CAA11]|uniref:cold-shock protein n=1 Tax=Paenibacillus sp. CAA11 TaxID=1532905 RepID=UPI000D3B8D97|nr:cold-shock protein [Paenibacillus sp. CAA11]AWB43205.1 cold-shock protein [Paenibacillus sp. CAA11]